MPASLSCYTDQYLVCMWHYACERIIKHGSYGQGMSSKVREF